MGELGLDLAGPKAKVARALELAEALEAEITEVVEGEPCSIQTEFNPYDGWQYFWANTPKRFDKVRLGLRAGEVIYHLRGSLDYLVQELARKAGVRPTQKHEFPIFIDPVQYARVAHPSHKDGKLEGIDIPAALEIIESVQPYHHESNPHEDTLFLIHRFSNADKHRMISVLVTDVEWDTFLVEPHEEIVRYWWPPSGFVSPLAERFKADGKHIVMMVRWKGSPPTEIETKGDQMGLILAFTTEAVGPWPRGIMGARQPLVACGYVTQLLESFEAL